MEKTKLALGDFFCPLGKQKNFLAKTLLENAKKDFCILKK